MTSVDINDLAQGDEVRWGNGIGRWSGTFQSIAADGSLVIRTQLDSESPRDIAVDPRRVSKVAKDEAVK